MVHSYEWSNHPAKDQIALQLHHLGGYSKRAVKKRLTIVLYVKGSYFMNQQFTSVSVTLYTLQNEVLWIGGGEKRIFFQTTALCSRQQIMYSGEQASISPAPELNSLRPSQVYWIALWKSFCRTTNSVHHPYMKVLQSSSETERKHCFPRQTGIPNRCSLTLN